MPIFRITIEERHNEWVEEIYHTLRDMFCTRVYEVEAEDEDEAQAMAHRDEGHLVSEEWDYGDSHDSEYYDSGEVVESEYVDCEVTCETLEDYEERYREMERQRLEAQERARAAYADWRIRRKLFRHGIDPDAKPSWEV